MYPALAVAAAIGNRAEMLWVGDRRGMEFQLVQRRSIAFEHVPAAGLHGVGLRSLPGNVHRMGQGYMAARRLMISYKPDGILLTGGYPGIPVALARRDTPLMLYVPDIEPGRAAKLVSRWADEVMVTTEQSRAYYPDRDRITVTGYPTRPWLERMEKDQARIELGLDPDDRVVLVFGGSRGAHTINEALWAELELVLNRTQVIHITGVLDWPQGQTVRDGLESPQSERYFAFPYLHEEMGLAFSAADLVVSRAGAAVLGEYGLYGLPAILVPYPHAWRYQHVNSEYLTGQGSAIQIEDSSLKQELAAQILNLLEQPDRLQNMSVAASRSAVPEAADRIANAMIRLMSEKTGQNHKGKDDT